MMAEAEKFTYHAGNIHELPLDKSLNMIQKELCSEYPDAQTQGFSRKMIQCAVRDLSVSEDRNSNLKVGTEHPIYQHLFCQHVDPENSDRRNDTHAAAIDWEVESFVKAVARARSTKKRLRGDALIEKTFDILADDIFSAPEEDFLKDVRTAALLKTDAIKNKLMQKYRPQIEARLNLIWYATLLQPASTASENMRSAIPVLDKLLIDLLPKIDFSFSPPDIDLSAVQNVYDNLESIRPSYSGDRAHYNKVFYFESNQHSKDLKECLDRAASAASEETLGSLKATYNNYLWEQYSESFKDILKFKDSYLDIRNYLQKEDASDLRKKVEDELSQYVRDIFQDVDNIDSILYTYSSYIPTYSDSAFITESTKRAHDQIWVALNEPFRLLKMIVFVKAFHLDTLLKLAPDENADATLRVLRELYQYIEQEIEKASKQYPNLPLMKNLTTAPPKQFIKHYCEFVLPIFADAALNKNQLADHLYVLQNQQSFMAALFTAAVLLRANAQIVAVYLVRECVKEIMDQHSALTYVLSQPEKGVSEKKISGVIS